MNENMLINNTNIELGNKLNLLNKLKKFSRLDEKEINHEKPKIGLIVDVEYWAYANIAKEVKRYLKNDYDIDIIPAEVFKNNVCDLIFIAQKYDLIHVFWRGYLACLEEVDMIAYMQQFGMNVDDFYRKYIKDKKITTSVYDHLFLNNETFHYTERIIKYCTKYTVSSKKLMDIYSEFDKKEKLWGEISDGVNLDMFKPKNLQRYDNIKNRIIRIGWVGNSNFKDSDNDDDLKGFKKIIKPAIDELINENYPIEKLFADRNEKLISHNEMPNYYNKIDIYICTSKTEGTPNPVLEAMACGVPIISTDVGIVREALGNLQKEFILKERTKECLKNAIRTLVEKPEMLKKLSNENLISIKKWSWKYKSKEFKQLFDSCLKER